MAYSPGTDKLSCPHCGKEIKAKKINKVFGNSNENDILDTCSECWRFIRKSHLTSPDDLETDLPEGTCWFCETRPAQDDKKAHVFLSKDEKTIYTGTRTRHEAKLLTFYVPRCSRCKKIQLWDKYLSAIPVIIAVPIFFLGVLVINPRLADAGASNSILGGVVCVVGIVSLLLGALVLNAIKKSVIPDSASTKGIYFKNFFPAVKALGEEGWKAQMDSQIG